MSINSKYHLPTTTEEAHYKFSQKNMIHDDANVGVNQKFSFTVIGKIFFT